jgi:hypothetical protein
MNDFNKYEYIQLQTIKEINSINAKLEQIIRDLNKNEISVAQHEERLSFIDKAVGTLLQLIKM